MQATEQVCLKTLPGGFLLAMDAFSMMAPGGPNCQFTRYYCPQSFLPLPSVQKKAPFHNRNRKARSFSTYLHCVVAE